MALLNDFVLSLLRVVLLRWLLRNFSVIISSDRRVSNQPTSDVLLSHGAW